MSVVQISVIVASILTGEWKWCLERVECRVVYGVWWWWWWLYLAMAFRVYRVRRRRQLWLVFGCGDKRETRACASSGARAHSSRGGRWYVALRGLEGRRGRRFPRFTALVRG